MTPFPISRILARAAASFCALMLGAGLALAITVNFEGEVSSLRPADTGDLFAGQLSVGDTFSGSFTYDETTSALTVPVPAPLNFLQYRGALSDFRLTFDSGASTGLSLGINGASNSDITLREDPSNATALNETVSVSSFVRYESGDLTGLSARRINLFLSDRTLEILDSAALTDVDWNEIFALGPLDFSSIQFFEFTPARIESHFADIRLTKLEVAAPAPIPLPASLPMVLSALVAFGVLRRRVA